MYKKHAQHESSTSCWAFFVEVEMISRFYTNKLVFGNKPQDIEGYDEAISSNELYIPHHKLEIDYTRKELKEMGRYNIVPLEELIWLPISKHHRK